MARMINQTLFFGGLLFLAALLARAVRIFAVQRLREGDRRAADKQMVELARLQAETGLRIEAMRDLLAGRQAELQRAVNERLDWSRIILANR